MSKAADALRAEIDAWIETDKPDEGPSPFVNLKASLQTTTLRTARQWAARYKVPTVYTGGRLLCRRADFEAARDAHMLATGEQAPPEPTVRVGGAGLTMADVLDLMSPGDED